MALRLIHRLSDEQILGLHELYQAEWWSRGRTIDETRRVVDGSDLLFALEEEETRRLAAFARVLTDYTFKAFLFDVIVTPEYRGEGLGARLMEAITSHPSLQGVRHLELYCLPELVPFYRRWGFTGEVGPIVLMRRGEVEPTRRQGRQEA